MNREDIIRMAREAGFSEHDGIVTGGVSDLERFARLIAKAEQAREESLKWNIHSCGPTCSRYACVATREAVLAEREACARECYEVFELDYSESAKLCADAIRARGSQ